MHELDIEKRAKFLKGKQRLFISQCQINLRLKNSELAKILKISVRTLTDWKREKFLIPSDKARELGKKASVLFPKKTKFLDKFWYTQKGSSLGGSAVYKKYGNIGGDQNYRLLRWREWWQKEGKFKKNQILNTPLPFKKPAKSEQLSEFIGIMLGDGGITNNQITITLHHIDDKKYSKYVIELIKKLFDVKPSIYHKFKDSVNNIVISRIGLVKFLTNELGLKIGNKIKQQIDIPNWIKRNRKFKIACLRGLMDTDGCLVIHKYKVRDKQYCYKKLNFCSASLPLVHSVIKILEDFNFKPRLSRNQRNVWIDNQKEVARYLAIIGSSNPKHLHRYKD